MKQSTEQLRDWHPEAASNGPDEIQDMVEWGEAMLDDAAEQTSKRSCISKLKVADNYLKRTRYLLLGFQRQGLSSLLEVRRWVRIAQETLSYIIKDEASELTLKELQEAAQEVSGMLKDARQELADAIVADEDRWYPGCRNAEGRLILGELCK